MKRETALRYAETIAARLRSHGGLIGTPDADREALRIARAWLFGSTAKGNNSPRDVDILLDLWPCGRLQLVNRAPWRGTKQRVGAKIGSTAYAKRYRLPLNCKVSALHALVAGMRMVRFHEFMIDGDLGDIPETRIMIYPRNDLGRIR